MASYKSTALFGGALVCDLPSTFVDVSDIRQIPDQQEVYLDPAGFTSIVFDITERVGGKGSGPEIDGRALTTHLQEVVGDDISGVKVWNTTETQITSLVDKDIPAYTLIATHAPVAPAAGSGAGGKEEDSSGGDKKAPDFTAFIMTLVRLERELTDMLITINVPHIRGEYDEDDIDMELGKQGKLIGDAVDYAARIWETFRIKDWTLFVEVFHEGYSEIWSITSSHMQAGTSALQDL